MWRSHSKCIFKHSNKIGLTWALKFKWGQRRWHLVRFVLWDQCQNVIFQLPLRHLPSLSYSACLLDGTAQVNQVLWCSLIPSGFAIMSHNIQRHLWQVLQLCSVCTFRILAFTRRFPGIYSKKEQLSSCEWSSTVRYGLTNYWFLSVWFLSHVLLISATEFIHELYRIEVIFGFSQLNVVGNRFLCTTTIMFAIWQLARSIRRASIRSSGNSKWYCFVAEPINKVNYFSKTKLSQFLTGNVSPK